MVTAARLKWACCQLTLGRKASIRINTHADKVIVHVRLWRDFDHRMKNVMAIHLLEYVVGNLGDTVAVDHGHNKSTGECSFSVVIKPAPLSASSLAEAEPLYPQTAIVASAGESQSSEQVTPIPASSHPDAYVIQPAVTQSNVEASPDIDKAPVKDMYPDGSLEIVIDGVFKSMRGMYGMFRDVIVADGATFHGLSQQAKSRFIDIMVKNCRDALVKEFPHVDPMECLVKQAERAWDYYLMCEGSAAGQSSDRPPEPSEAPPRIRPCISNESSQKPPRPSKKSKRTSQTGGSSHSGPSPRSRGSDGRHKHSE